MKEEWLFPGASVPVDIVTTLALINEIKRLIGVVGGMALKISDQDALLTRNAERIVDLQAHINNLEGEQS